MLYKAWFVSLDPCNDPVQTVVFNLDTGVG